MLRRNLPSLGIYLFLLFSAVLATAPLFFSVLTSLRTEADLTANGGLSLPSSITFNNYTELFSTQHFIVPLAVTLQMVLVITAGQMCSNVLAAYAFARLTFPGRDTLFWVYLSTLMVPAIVTIIPLFSVLSTLGLRNTFAGLVLPLMFGSPYGIFLLRENFRAMPQEIFDAATIDGASPWRQIRSLVLPMNKPIIVALTLITIVSQWNNFLWPSLIAPQFKWNVLTVATSALQTQYSSNWTLVMAATTVSILPLLVLFLVFNKAILSGYKLDTGSR